MPFIYKIATININGISSANRILLLGEFLFQNDIDIALLQEVTTNNLTSICNYTVFDNIGTDGRGTAILAKPGINLTEVKRLPSGRGIAASFFGTKIVNIYAPSGAEKKRVALIMLIIALQFDVSTSKNTRTLNCLVVSFHSSVLRNVMCSCTEGMKLCRQTYRLYHVYHFSFVVTS